MNPFQRARNEARALREILAPGKANGAVSARDLLGAIEEKLGLAIFEVEAGYPDLGNGQASLQRAQKTILIQTGIAKWGENYCALVAHEIGHWTLDANKTASTIATLKMLFGSEGCPAVLKVEAYGARERQELQANVFARELLLPRQLAKALAQQGMRPLQIASKLGIPLEFVRQQTLDGVLLPPIDELVTALHAPSDDQRKAARATGRAANVVAGPGSGKTATLIHRVKHLIEEKQVDPSHILVMTFTNKAALELTERLRSAGIGRAADIWAGTFHSFGLEFLRKYHQHFALEPEVRVADRLAALTMMVALLPHLDLKFYSRIEDPYEWLGPVLKAILRLKEQLVSPEQYSERIAKLTSETAEIGRRREDVAMLFHAYEKLLQSKGLVDFVDLVSKPAIAIKADRPLFSEAADKFQHILVDEYQDVTEAMVQLLRQLAQKAKSIWVVGDIRQAIHHWRGASLRSLMKFNEQFKAQVGDSTIQRFSLKINRRSHKEILDLIDNVGRNHSLQSEFPLDEMTSKKGVCNELPTVVTCEKQDQLTDALVKGVLLLKSQGVDFGKQAVLCRGSADVAKSAEALANAGVPILYVGELANHPEVKKVLCLMQLLVERQPRALIGLVEVPGLNMPMADIEKMIDQCESDVTLQRGRWLRNSPQGLSRPAIAVINRLKTLIGHRTYNSNPWDFVCDVLLESSFLTLDPKDASVAAWVQRIALWQFAYSVRNGDGEIKEARLSRFMLRHRLRQRIGETYEDRELPPEAANLDGVRVQTIHGSKGLEYPAVHIGNVTANSFGSKAPTWKPLGGILEIVPPEVLGSSRQEYEFEEAVERNNLLYVAVSRAERHLRLYQDSDFSGERLAPQLQGGMLKVNRVQYSHSSAARSVIIQAAFKPPTPLHFDHLDIYAHCALQYWYARILGLKSEADLDPAFRARISIMRALRLIASGAMADSEEAFVDSWQSLTLPSESEDRALWRDAYAVFSSGTALISNHLAIGSVFAEPQTSVANVTIQLPWGFVSKSSWQTTFTMVRFWRRRHDEIARLLKPMISGLPYPGQKTIALSYVTSGHTDSVQSTYRPTATKAYQAAERFLAGDNRPTKGDRCGHCAYLTICPNAPTYSP